ncbi:helix-turn-helix domain-containing protein [Pseudonocardia halophobica]|uniref:helix-turn-helix domain-containing protein n=1 Tax=Pseudonocardia halophobica TaxID=29401 RepID=UPI003D8B0774
MTAPPDSPLRGLRAAATLPPTDDPPATHVLAPGEPFTVPATGSLVLCGVLDGGLAEPDLARGGAVLARRSAPTQAGRTGARLLICTYAGAAGGLPDLAVVSDGVCPDLLARVAADGPPLLRERLLTATLACWFARPHGAEPTWSADPVVGPALAAIDADPARPWTVAALAAAAGVAPTDFAARFRTVVGVAPLAHLRQRRMRLAADYLAEPAATVAAVARRVGYADPFSFSAVFTQERGVSPAEVRGSRV